MRLIGTITGAVASGSVFLVVNAEPLSKIIHGSKVSIPELVELDKSNKNLEAKINAFIEIQDRRDDSLSARLAEEIQNNRKLGEAICELNNGPPNETWVWCDPKKFIKPISSKKDSRKIIAESKYGD